MTPIERLKRARERYGEARGFRTTDECELFIRSRGWTEDGPWYWKHDGKNETGRGIQDAMDIENETDLTELIAAVDAVVKGEMERN